MPQSMHHKRDFSIFVDAFNREGTFSAKLRSMYAKELLKTGDEKDFAEALPIFRLIYDSGTDTDGHQPLFPDDTAGYAVNTMRRNLS